MERARPNSWQNRYNQWVLAGKIAEARHEMTIEIESSKKCNSIYRTNGGSIHYSMVGQEYLRRIGVPITDLA